VEIVSQLVSQ